MHTSRWELARRGSPSNRQHKPLPALITQPADRTQQYDREAQERISDGKTRLGETKAGLNRTYVLYSLDADLLAFNP